MNEEKGLTAFGDKGIEIRTMNDAMQFAEVVAKSGLAPRGMDTKEQVFLAVETGMELGLSPMRSIQSVVVVNGRATLMGEAALALIRGSGLLEMGCDIQVGCRPGEGGNAEEGAVGFCSTKRAGGKWIESTFSVADAKKARLWAPPKGGPWAQYPKRMLMWRAVAFHTRDHWSDVTHGVMLADEMQDMKPPARDVTPQRAVITGGKDPLLQADDDVVVLDEEGSIVAYESSPASAAEEPEIDPETGEVVPEWVE